MKITLLHGQNHKGSTYHVSKMTADKLNGVLEEFFLPKDLSENCLGCFNCLNKGREFCPHFSEVSKIFDSMLSSDIIIIDSPTYVMEMSGQLKSFFDHIFTAWLPHRPEEAMFSKVAIAVSTAAGAGMKRVTKSIARQLFYLGVPKVYRISERVAATFWNDVKEKKKKKINKNINKIARKAIKNSGKIKPKFKLKFMFSIMRLMQKSNDYAPLDKKYWEEKNWLKKARPWKAVK